ncbi:E6 early protein [Bos taurus papillomavirus 27]|nr:E6 early protein [Bos taurus papillomavirus 27]QYI89671.1 E6 early protein [Bos taurus papillomavirus 27]
MEENFESEDLWPWRRRRPKCILCMVCGVPLSPEETKKFHKKGLRSVKKQKKNIRRSYGACDRCCFLLAAQEANSCCAEDITLEGDGVSLFTGLSLDRVHMWCLYCLATLTDDDKVENVLNNKPFVKRRGRWRGTCHSCANI